MRPMAIKQGMHMVFHEAYGGGRSSIKRPVELTYRQTDIPGCMELPREFGSLDHFPASQSPFKQIESQLIQLDGKARLISLSLSLSLSLSPLNHWQNGETFPKSQISILSYLKADMRDTLSRKWISWRMTKCRIVG